LFTLPALLGSSFTVHRGRRSFRFQRWRFTSSQSFSAGAGQTFTHAQHDIRQPDISQDLGK
jgi:hypothetical protein